MTRAARGAQTLHLTLKDAVAPPRAWRTSSARLFSQGRRNRMAFCIFQIRRAHVPLLTQAQASLQGFSPLWLTRSVWRAAGGLLLVRLRLTAGRTKFSKRKIDTSAETF